MKDRNRQRLLLTSNVVLLLLLLAVCIHEGYLQRVYRRVSAPAPKPYSYTDNLHFLEALDFDTLYHSHPSVVMIGNSMTQKMEWGELLGRCDVSMRGVHGDITAGILARIDAAIALHPKAIFIEGGINDMDMRLPVQQIAQNIQHAAERVQSAGIIPVLTAVTHVTAAYPQADSVNKMITVLDQSLQSFAAANSFDFINLNPIIAPSGQLLPQYARMDGCHLTAKAYRLWADAILRILGARGI
jgi:lysophospholipase L1-like esterase